MEGSRGKVFDDGLVVEALYGPAWILRGSTLGDEVLLDLVRSEFPGRSYCVVRQWMLLDIMLPVAVELYISRQGLQPTVLFANHVVQGSELPSARGKSILTGFQKSFEDCFFESKKTLFILAGSGSRKHVSWPAYAALTSPQTRRTKGLVTCD